MLIRPRTDEDVPACLALMRRTHELDGYPRYWRADPQQFLVGAGEQAAWVAERDGTPVGHVAVHDASGNPVLPAAQAATGAEPAALAVVARLLVSPDARRTGVGARLLDEATAWVHAQGRRPVLDVLQDEPGVIALYERRGWQRLDPVVLPIEGHEPLLLWVYLGPPPPLSAVRAI